VIVLPGSISLSVRPKERLAREAVPERLCQRGCAREAVGFRVAARLRQGQLLLVEGVAASSWPCMHAAAQFTSCLPPVKRPHPHPAHP